MRRILKFRNLQQKLGFYSFLVSLLALTAFSAVGYRVARDQIQEDREQLMEVQAGQIVQQLQDELNSAAREIQIVGELGVVRAGLERPRIDEAQAFLDDLLEHQPRYDLIFSVDREGRLASINSLAASVTGQPFRDENDSPAPLGTLVPGTPVELDQAIQRCLRKDAAERYQTTLELLADLLKVPGSVKSSATLG